MHAVLSLFKDTGLRSLKHRISHFEFIQAEFFMDLSANRGSEIMEGRQAVHEDGVRRGSCHQLVCDLVGLHLFNALCPCLHGFAHGNPDIRVEDVPGAGVDVGGR